MLPASPLPQLVPARVPSVLKRIGKLVGKDVAPSVDLAATEPTERHRPVEEAARETLEPFSRPHHDSRLRDQRGWRLRPPKASGRPTISVRWNDQPGATVDGDGAPYHGFDPSHRIAPLPPGRREVWIGSAVYLIGIWTSRGTGWDPQGSRFKGAPSLQPAWAVPSEGGSRTLRLHDTLGRSGTAIPGGASDCRLRRTDLARADRGLLRSGTLEYRPRATVSARSEPTA